MESVSLSKFGCKNEGKIPHLYLKKQSKLIYCSCMHVYLRHVGYGNVAWFSYHTYGEIGFESRLIKTGEGCTSKGGFKLSGCQNPDSETIVRLFLT